MRKIIKTALIGFGIAIASLLSGCGGGGADEPPQAPQVTTSVPTKTQQDAIMTYGLQITDSAGRLVASAGLPTPHYLGTATYQETLGFVSGQGSLSRYRCSSPAGAPLPFLEFPPDSSVFAAVKRVVSAGSGEWDIFIVAGTQGTQSYTTTSVPVVTAVHCFGPHPGTAGETYGFRVYAADGSVNFSALDKPLLLDEIVTLPAGAVSPVTSLGGVFGYATRTVQNLQRPAVAVHAAGQAWFETGGGSVVPLWGAGFAVSVNASTVNRVLGMRNFAGPQTSLGAGDSTASYPAEDVLIVDMARYVN